MKIGTMLRNIFCFYFTFEAIKQNIQSNDCRSYLNLSWYEAVGHVFQFKKCFKKADISFLNLKYIFFHF